jgi:hypothetical protein
MLQVTRAQATNKHEKNKREGGHSLAYSICQEHICIALHRPDQVAVANKRNPNIKKKPNASHPKACKRRRRLVKRRIKRI